MRQLIVVVIGILSCMCAACAQRPALIPLAVGNSWSYEETVPDKHARDGKPRREDYELRISIRQTRDIGSIAYFGLDVMALMSTFYLAVCDSGVCMALDTNTSIVLFRYPAVPSDSYVVDARRFGRIPVEVVSIDAPIDVDGTSRLAYHYRFRMDELIANLFIVPGIGIVRYVGEFIVDDETLSVQAQLVKFTRGQ